MKREGTDTDSKNAIRDGGEISIQAANIVIGPKLSAFWPTFADTAYTAYTSYTAYSYITYI